MRVRSKGIMRMIRRIKLVRNLLYLLLLCVTSAAVAQAQNWSGILSPSRATDWTKAGLPATLPDGETTPNPWTPPTRTQCGSTITTASFSGMSSSNYVAPTALNNAIAACPQGEYVHVAAGNYYFSSAIVNETNGVTLHSDDGVFYKFNEAGMVVTITSGSGLLGGGSGVFPVGIPSYAQGANTVYLSSVTGLTAGSSILAIYQCFDEDSASTIAQCSGSTTDTGGILQCGVAASGPTNPCSDQGVNAGQQLTGNEFQFGLITAINANGVSGCAAGSGNYCVVFSPGLLAPNWSSARTPYVNAYNFRWGIGLEGGSFDSSGQTGQDQINFRFCYGCWIKGIRAIGGSGSGGDGFIPIIYDLNDLVMSNYFWTHYNIGSTGSETQVLSNAEYVLFLNDIVQAGPPVFSQGGLLGDVYAYNYSRDGAISGGSSNYQYVNNMWVTHNPGDFFILHESNQEGQIQDDSIHGSHNLNTFFRNAYIGDPPYLAINTKSKSMDWQGVSRFENAIGNVLGWSLTTTYQVDTTTSQPNNYIAVFQIGTDNGPTRDPSALTFSYRWGNYDVITQNVRWCGNSSSPDWSLCGGVSEVPTSLSGAAAPFDQSIPSSTTLPPSFFLPVQTAYANGGTGLNWWKVCTNYPTCSTFTTEPYPPIGPDVSGGAIHGSALVTGGYGGHAYDIPAYVAWKNLPIDTSFQIAASITASSWSSGIETISIGTPWGDTPMGEFQIKSGTCAGTYEITNVPASGQVSFALASNPGTNACNGTNNFLWPDIRQFGSTVYQNDSSGSGSGSNPPAPPTNLTVVVQ